MRHWIQKGGHECLPLLLTVVGIFAAILFYLGNVFGHEPPVQLVVFTLVILAICTEWLTFTFNQDMQDAITQRRNRGFAIFKAIVACAVSTFIFASASIGLWAPRNTGGSSVTWAWILAVGVFGAQFLLKLTPEKSKAPHSLVNIAAAVEEWAPSASAEVQAQIAQRVFTAIASPNTSVPALPSASDLTIIDQVQSAQVAKNGHNRPFRRQAATTTNSTPTA